MDDYEKLIIKPNQSSKKLRAFLDHITRKDSFQQDIKRLRRKHIIPIEGFPLTEDHRIPPDAWERNTFYYHDLIDLCQKYQLYIVDGSFILEHYLFYNSLDHFNTELGNLCIVSDLKSELVDPFERETQESMNEHFPLAIRISPYASQRDIIDFVKKAHGLISHFQKSYRKADIKIGKIKTKQKNNMQVADIIWTNRKKTLVAIQSLLEESGYHLDQGEIGKIRSLEKQRRKDM